MPNAEDHILDVDFRIVAVNDQGEVPVHPRLPNVVSRRGHALKITAWVRDVPYRDNEFPVTVTLDRAEVSVYRNPDMGEEGDISRRKEFWGRNVEHDTKTIDARDDLPRRLEVTVFQVNHDDHLGQGPDYESAIEVTATPDTVNREKAGDGGAGSEGTPQLGGTDHTRDEDHDDDKDHGFGRFIIPFSAR